MHYERDTGQLTSTAVLPRGEQELQLPKTVRSAHWVGGLDGFGHTGTRRGTHTKNLSTAKCLAAILRGGLGVCARDWHSSGANRIWCERISSWVEATPSRARSCGDWTRAVFRRSTHFKAFNKHLRRSYEAPFAKILYLTDLAQKLLFLRIFSYLCAEIAISARI